MIRRWVCRLIFAIAAFAAASPLCADTRIPRADRPGSKDSPVLQRYQGSFIIVYEHKGFDEFTLPLSKLEPIPGKEDDRHNRFHEPRKKKTVEGPYTRLVYLIPENRSPLEVIRNYQDEIKRRGGTILFECKAAECGGDPLRASIWERTGSGNMSLSLYIYPQERIKEPDKSVGACALKEKIVDQRYAAAELPGAHVSVLTYTIAPKYPGCEDLKERTIAVVDIVEGQAREQKMVTVQSDEMASAIAGGGRVALYGIYFDFNKADLKPESDPTLEQIGKLLKDTPALRLLVVGHTDNVGSFASNMDLSQRRAAAVVAVLATRYGAARDRLTPVGVSFASPVSSNRNEEGRAKNRRVELVEHLQAARQ